MNIHVVDQSKEVMQDLQNDLAEKAERLGLKMKEVMYVPCV